MKKRLVELKKLFQNNGIRWKKWRGLVTVMAMLVVFVTTYALILPAITLEKNQGKPEQGVYLDPMERGSTAALKNEEKTDQPEESTSLGTGTQADQTENTDETAFSGGSQDDGSDTEGKNADGGLDQGQKTAYAQGVYTGRGDGLTVSMDLTEEMRLPADVTVSVKEIMENEESVELGIDYQACLTAAKKAAAREGRGKIAAVRFFKFALLSGDKEIQTDQDIDMLVKPLEKDLVRKGDQVHVLAFSGSAASMIEDIKTQMSGYRVSAYRFLYPSIAGNSNWGLLGLAVTEPKTEDKVSETTGTEEEISTESEAATESASTTETAASTEETTASTEETAASEATTETEPASTETPSTEAAEDDSRLKGTLDYNGKDYRVMMTYDEKAGIPESAVLQVTEIQEDSKDYERYLKEASETLEMDKKADPNARFFDIKIMDGEKEIEPAAPVSVQISYDQPMKVNEGDKVDALHFGEKKTEVIEDVDVKTNRRDDVEGVAFEANSFSVYGIVTYTVDFHYEAKGKMYEFSIPGGGFVSLEHLVEVLGIGESDKSGESSENKVESASMTDEEINNLNNISVSEETKKFVADVASVEFSSPDLVWSGKIKEETTVREIKEDNELEVRYSGRLTVKDIAHINAQMVDAGDWALISVKPFDTEEVLTITMKNGDSFNLKLTGNALYGNEKIQYTSADGTMIVTAAAPVGTLPAGTKIQVREISPDNVTSHKEAEKTAHLYTETVNALADTLYDKNVALNDTMLCDISFIDASGHEIEPDGRVDIALSYNSLSDEDDKKVTGSDWETETGVAHILSTGDAELLDADIDTDQDNDTSEAVFTSDSFSVYVVFNTTPVAQKTDPVYFDDGWIRFGENNGSWEVKNTLPSGHTSDSDGWKSYLTVNVYKLKSGANNTSTNPNDYTLSKSFSYLSGYYAGDKNKVDASGNMIEKKLIVEDYKFNSNVVFTTFTPSDRDTITYDGMQASYPTTSAHHSWHDDPNGYVWESDANILNIYLDSNQQTQINEHKTDYVIRYYHADGTFETRSGSLKRNDSPISFSPADKIKEGNELYSGLTIGAGHDALSNTSINTGTGTISFNSDISLVKVNVYYKENIEIKNGGQVTGQPLYDASIVNNSKRYDTSREGLHTDKTAAAVTNSPNAALNDGRTFNLTLETWNIGASYANIGMVLDASGSMVWPSDLPQEVRVPKSTLSTYGSKTTHTINNGHSSQSVTGYFLTQDQVNSILDTNYTDPSKLSYNGYRYYLKDPVYNVNEYVPLGYYDGSHTNGATFVNTNTNSATKGWYYVTSATATNYRNNGTAKQYSAFPDQNSAWQNSGSTASQFWLDDDGILHCYWYREGRESDGGTKYYKWNSKVYVSPTSADNKSEVLQHGLARFAALLDANSPTSQVSMTRFSRARSSDNFTAAQLALLNWTTDAKLITAAMNQQYGAGTATSPDTQNGLNVYNYGFTGDTSTASGIDAFIKDMTLKAAGHYAPTSGNTNASKYLIIFTDGKDTDRNSSNSLLYGPDSAKNYTDALKTEGYTIFTVMMQSAGMTPDDVSTSESFLRSLSGKTGEDGNTQVDGVYKYYFNFMYNDPDALVTAFQKIAKEITKPLEGYVVRDYIDPRFDIIDSDGNVLTKLNYAGIWNPRPITTADGKTAMLKYDTTKKMFYVEIDNQSIPTTPQNSNQVTVNTTVLTARAKEDFAGGNNILSNGNESGQNSVFKPADGSSVNNDFPTPAHPGSTYTKDFPKTTTDPAALNITLSNYEDTIFLEETISPANLYESVQTKRDSATDYRSVYINYLMRAGDKLQDDSTYYVNLLKYAAVPAGAPNSNPGKDKNGNDISDFEFVTDINGVTTLTLPYYYLENPGDVTSYAGGNLHQADKAGKVTYSWKAIDTGGHTLTDNNALKDYTSTTLDTVKYQLTINYTPDATDLRFVLNNQGIPVSDSFADNGSVRTLTLTGQTGRDKLIKDPVGAAAQSQQTDPDTQGLAVIHVVAGKFKVIKRIEISDADWTNLVTKAGDNGLTFTFQLKKDGVNYGDPFTINTNTAEKTVNGNYIELSSDWIDTLPKGNYTVEETGQPEGFTYKSVAIAAVTADDADSSRTGGTPFAAPTTGTATWEIGSVDGGVPTATTYADTDFSAAKVKDANKEVDPDKSKVYLNAQIGKGVVLNEPPKTKDITFKKIDKSTGESIGGAKFALIKGSEYVDLETFTITKLVSTEEDPVVETITIGSNPNIKVVTVPKGGIKIEALEDGSYILKEMTAPAGYVITDSGAAFTIENGDLKDHTDPEDGINFIVENEPGAELPSTGGPGTTALYLLGIMLTSLAGACLVMRKRSKAA